MRFWKDVERYERRYIVYALINTAIAFLTLAATVAFFTSDNSMAIITGLTFVGSGYYAIWCLAVDWNLITLGAMDEDGEAYKRYYHERGRPAAPIPLEYSLLCALGAVVASFGIYASSHTPGRGYDAAVFFFYLAVMIFWAGRYATFWKIWRLVNDASSESDSDASSDANETNEPTQAVQISASTGSRWPIVEMTQEEIEYFEGLRRFTETVVTQGITARSEWMKRNITQSQYLDFVNDLREAGVLVSRGQGARQTVPDWILTAKEGALEAAWECINADFNADIRASLETTRRIVSNGRVVEGEVLPVDDEAQEVPFSEKMKTC